jgi:hypothetical protein
MSTSNEENEPSYLTFDQIAKSLGVEFKESGVSIPCSMEATAFRLIMLHYNERKNASANIKWIMGKFIDCIETCKDKEEHDRVIRAYQQIIDQLA